VANGSIRLIAAAEAKRLPDYPDLPTIDETIPGVINIGWNGLLAPAGTPTPIIDKLNAATVDVLKKPDVIAKMKVQGLTAMSDTPAEFSKLIADEIAYWGKVIPAIGIKPE
jgi:tripartite-type tricarboxylate transporter receptor subunit TctC